MIPRFTCPIAALEELEFMAENEPGEVKVVVYQGDYLVVPADYRYFKSRPVMAVMSGPGVRS